MLRQNTGDEVTRQNSDGEKPSMEDLKGVLRGEFDRVKSELKEIEQNFRDLDFRLLSTEGTLSGLEIAVRQLQGEASIAKLRIASIEESVGDT